MKKRKFRVYTIGIVKWKDAYMLSDVDDASKLEPHAIMETVGFPVKITKEAISLAAERCPEDGTLRGVTTIPVAYIVDYCEFECKGEDIDVQPAFNSPKSETVGIEVQDKP